MKTVAVSQVPVVSEALAAVAPPVVGGSVAAFPPALRDLARFFLNLAGSSSQGAVLGDAGAMFLHPEGGVSCALQLRVEEQPLLVLRRRLILWRLDLLLHPLLCPVRPADGSVRKNSPARVGTAVARPALGPSGRIRDDLGNAPLPLFALLADGWFPIGLLRGLTKKVELSHLLWTCAGRYTRRFPARSNG